MCDRMNREINKCFELGCRYHMVADFITRKTSDRDITRKIIAAKYTCLLEIIDLFPDGLSHGEIAATLFLSKQRVEQIENRVFEKMKLRSRHLEAHLVDDPEVGYQRPGGVQAISPSRWPLMLGAATAKNFAFNS